MSDENKTDSASGNAPDLSQNIDDMLASLSPQKSTGAGARKDQRKAPRFRVNWHADILIDDQVAYQCFIHDISTLGASVFLNTNLHTNKCTLHIHVPPLDLKSKPHIIEATGKLVYVVFDGNQQLFRVAINFLSFRPESDLAYLGERLTRYHSRIPEP